MKVSDYLVEFFISKGITDVFGYPGGMVTHLMNSFAKHAGQISAHVTYHEQAAAFAACGYAQISGKVGVAYATSGPGATNLITGICNAYFDSIPVIFITGQVNSNELSGQYKVRQRGFQETDIVSMVTSVTKCAVRLEDPEKIQYEIEKAYEKATSGRPGPVLLDICMDVFRADIEINPAVHNSSNEDRNHIVDINSVCNQLSKELQTAKCPVFLIGAGIKCANKEKEIKKALEKIEIPVVSSMISFDVMPDNPHYYGFVGAYGTRTANFIVAKSDLIITIGSRLDIRQVGAKRENFAPNAKIIRYDIDMGELSYKVHSNEIQHCIDIDALVKVLNRVKLTPKPAWLAMCEAIKKTLSKIDTNRANEIVEKLSKLIPPEAVITTDVGQNQVWVVQSFKMKKNQKVLFSGGLGSMGYSLPAAIGAYYGSGKRPVWCFSGDGGIQMNIQELQYLARENIPVKIIVLNNNSLGMIRQFQEIYFESRYFQTVPRGGYNAPDFAKVAKAYGIKGETVDAVDVDNIAWAEGPELYDIHIDGNTYVTPKLEFGKPNQDQAPYIDRKLYGKMMNMKAEDFSELKCGGGGFEVK